MKDLFICVEATIILFIVIYVIYKQWFKPKETIYKVKVKFYSGDKVKFELNTEQYEQFKAWLNQSEGIYDIGDDSDKVTLNKKYVTLVGVKKYE